MDLDNLFKKTMDEIKSENLAIRKKLGPKNKNLLDSIENAVDEAAKKVSSLTEFEKQQFEVLKASMIVNDLAAGRSEADIPLTEKKYWDAREILNLEHRKLEDLRVVTEIEPKKVKQ